MKINKNSISRIKTTDFSDLRFGTVFSDHMFVCHYIDGKWKEPEILPYGPLKMNPGSQVLHYGQSIFEGMKAFKSHNNELLLFRKEENFKRLNKSAIRLSIPTIPESLFMQGLDRLLDLDRQWCKVEEGYSLYIRPFIFASSECIKASSADQFTFMIITSPTTHYYSEEVNLIIEENFTRASQGGVGFAKAAGNYAASFYPTKQANAKGFQQVLWTDAGEHKYIEECGTMNIWFRVGNKLITPELSDTILGGITRDSIITLAKDNGIDVEVKKIPVSDIIEAYDSGVLKEVFGTGTAVSVSPISSITFRESRMSIPVIEDAFSLSLKKQLQAIQKGKVSDSYNWITKVPIAL